tara:strand:- start:4533 stop:5708 length:1176 start_codon:yes stop_codon:yes gene_type:complete
MNRNLIILGSTGSIGTSTINILKKNKEKFKIKLLTSNTNAKKLLNQAILFNVKNVIIEEESKFKKYKNIFKKKKINLHLGIKNINKILKTKVDYCINSISGISGLEPTLNIIPFSKNLLIANKESIICAWNLINKKLKKHNTNFIPIDSEHFSIMELIKNEKKENIDRIILTASGGPFLNKSNKYIYNINPRFALKHPNWKMGKKISIDSATMMNKVFEFIEAKKIFNLNKKYLSILIHPSSYIHAIVFFKGNLIKFLAHETSMSIPISNALNIKHKLKKNYIKSNVNKFNELKLHLPSKNKFPLLSILDYLPDKETYFEIILITINDELVNKYLKGKINFLSIQKNLLNLIKSPYFKKFYKLKPKNIYDIKKMIIRTKSYLELKLKYYEK